MRFLGYLKKTIIENFRDWKILMFALGFAPCFVIIIYMMYGSGQQSFSIALINKDTGRYGTEVVNSIKKATFEDRKLKYKVILNESLEVALTKLKNKNYDAVAVLQADFSQVIEKAKLGKRYESSRFKLYGDPQNMRYSIASIYLLTDLDQFVINKTHYKQPVILDEKLIGRGSSLTDFDMYVPKIIVFALLNVLFTAGASLLKEVEKGTMKRLVLSRLKVFEFIGAISVIQVVVCMISMTIAISMAVAFGFEIKGSMFTIIFFGMLSAIGIMGLALLTASALTTVYDLMTVGIIPYFIIMFFGGIFFPLPQMVLTHIGEHALMLTDLLPLSMSVTTLDKIMNFGAGFSDLTYELIGIVVINGIYFMLGLLAYHRKHMRLG